MEDFYLSCCYKLKVCASLPNKPYAFHDVMRIFLITLEISLKIMLENKDNSLKLISLLHSPDLYN